MKFISNTWKDYSPNEEGKIEIPSNEVDNINNEIQSILGINETSTPPSLIIIDEISKFSGLDMDLINNFAKKYGITILAAGDFDQSGIVGNTTVNIGNHKNINWDISIERNHFIRSPKLGVSMRTGNQLKSVNL